MLTVVPAHTLSKTRKPTARVKAKVVGFRSLPLPLLRQQFAMHPHPCPQQCRTHDERHKLVLTQQPVQVHRQFQVHPMVLFNLLLPLPPPTTSSLNPDR